MKIEDVIYVPLNAAPSCQDLELDLAGHFLVEFQDMLDAGCCGQSTLTAAQALAGKDTYWLRDNLQSIVDLMPETGYPVSDDVREAYIEFKLIGIIDRIDYQNALKREA